MPQYGFTSSKLLSIVLLVLTIIQMATASSSLRIREQCDKMSKTTRCSCTNIHDFEITCYNEDNASFLTMNIKYNDNIQINCDRKNRIDFSRLPKMRLERIPTIQFRHCPLSPLQSILQKLGISNVNSLYFEYGTIEAFLERLHFQGLEGLNYLQLNSNGLSYLPEDVFADLKNLSHLNLRSNKVELSQNIFDPLENLSLLELGHNSLQDLPPGIFHNQNKLTKLNLWGNNLTKLRKEVFEGLSSMTDLDLSGNNIVELQGDVFSLLKSLKNINLDSNYFQSLPESLFAENKNLSSFRLNNNRVPLNHLPEGLLSNLPILQEVRLSCDLQTIPRYVFAKSTAIKNITISGNSLTELPYLLLADQVELIDLDLTKNKLVELPDDIFQNTRNLIVLRLSHNRLANISSDLFSSLRKLKYLYMDNNNLLNIHPTAFNYNTNLIYINMDNNQIQLYQPMDNIMHQIEIVSPFRFMRDLKILKLRNNSIHNIFRDWKRNLPKLNVLDLSYNKIIGLTINDLQFNCRQLELDLTHNAIRIIDFNGISTITKNNQKLLIHIGHNPVNCDCKLFDFVQFLKLSTLNGLQVSVANLQCSAPKNLEERSVKELLPEELLCSLKQCPIGCSCAVRSFDRTLILNCSNGGFTKIPKLPTLAPTSYDQTELHIQNNKLTELPNGTTPGYRTVTKLYVANNNLTKISVDQLPLHLSFLDLTHNKLKGLNNSFLEAFNRSRNELALSHNPWLCDCTSLNLLQFVQTNFKLIPDLKEMQCDNGENFQQLKPGAICPIKQGVVIAASLSMSLIGLCFAILAALYYKYQQEIKVWLYAHNMCLWFVTEEELDKDKKFDAFVSYSHKDEDFITDFLIPELEHGPTHLKLCLHFRDWIVGEPIPNQIVQSVIDSRRTIIILSANFIESVWARMEFRAAHTAALNEGRARVIIIIYGDIGNIDNLEPELNAYLKMNTYVKWGDPYFWNKLRYAMPHPSHNLSRSANTTVDVSADDKLNILKMSTVNPLLKPTEEANRDPLIAEYQNINYAYSSNGKLPNGNNGRNSGEQNSNL